MSAWSLGDRPTTIAVLAMGGEGGGVLSEWIAAVARSKGWIAQTTSVAGVAQRTGATVYYIELYPPSVGHEGSARSEPIMSTMPTPGQVDLLIGSELMEAGRAVERGLVTPDRTTMIASTNRVYSILEKSGLGDARVDSTELLAGAHKAAKRLIAADFMALAVAARSVVSASLLGAVAGSDALAFDRDSYEEAIRASGKGVDESLAAFAAGFSAARHVIEPPPPTPQRAPVPVTIGARPVDPEEQAAQFEAEQDQVARTDPRRIVGPALQEQADRVARDFPAAARLMLLRGLERTALYQNTAYADRYLDRVAQVAALETDVDGPATLTREAARFTALWMCYQDTIHVALQKTRVARLAGIRTEARAKADQPVQVREYLHPMIEEITDTMPVVLGRYLRQSKPFGRVVHILTHRGMVVNTTSISGYTTLSLLARLRPIRPRSLRFAHEQEQIDAWLEMARQHARDNYDLACQIVECARLLKGYGETWERGETRFDALLAAVPRLSARASAANDLKELITSALADETGVALNQRLSSLDLPAPGAPQAGGLATYAGLPAAVSGARSQVIP